MFDFKDRGASDSFAEPLSQRWISGRLALGSLCESNIALAPRAAHEARAIKLLVTLRNAQVRRISWVPWGSAGREAVRVASS